MDDCIRILYLVDTLADSLGDTFNHLQRLTRHLDQDKFHLRVISMRKTQPGVAPGRLLCPVESIGMKGTGPLSMSVARLRLRHKLRSVSCDLICAYGWVARAIGLPSAKSVNSAVRLSVVRDMGFGLTARSLVALQRSNASASRFIASSGAIAARLTRQEGVRRDRIDIIPDGIDCGQVAERTPAAVAEAKHGFGFSVHQPVILMNAPFGHPSDHSTFLEAAAHLLPHHPEARFVLLGQGDKSAVAGVRAKAADLRLLDRVIFVFDQSSATQWLHAADVGVVASLLETYPDTLLTFMAAGLPVVATHAGGNSEIVHNGKTGYLVNAMEADALAMRIHILLRARDLAAKFSAAARERVRTEFGVKREIQQFSDYYRTLALSAPGGWLED